MLTDREPELVTALEAAVARLSWSDSAAVSVAQYTWGDPISWDHAPPRGAGSVVDLVLGADCLYSHLTTSAFCDALDMLARANGFPPLVVLVSCEERQLTAECLEVAAARGWQSYLLETVTMPPMPTEASPATVRLLQLRFDRHN